MKVIMHSIPGHKIEISHSVQALADRLRKPVFDIGVVVLFVNTGEDLAEILKLADFFWDLRTIIILPDSDPETIKKAHRMSFSPHPERKLSGFVPRPTASFKKFKRMDEFPQKPDFFFRFCPLQQFRKDNARAAEAVVVDKCMHCFFRRIVASEKIYP